MRALCGLVSFVSPYSFSRETTWAVDNKLTRVPILGTKDPERLQGVVFCSGAMPQVEGGGTRPIRLNKKKDTQTANGRSRVNGEW